MDCKYCGKKCKNTNSLKNHQIRCSENPVRIDVKPPNNSGRKGTNQYTKAKELGLPKPTYKITEETRKKITDANIKRFSNLDEKKKHSKAMKKAVKENPDSYTKNNVCGRVKMIEYNGVNLKGLWEVTVAKWLDSNNIKWLNEVNPQPYYWNSDWHMYFPDFYLPEHDVYIEVKGYKTDRDDAKWSQFKNDLIIVDSKNINILNDYSYIHELTEKYRYAPVV